MKVKFSFLAFLMIVLVAPVAFMACSDDDGGNDPIPEELLGTWRRVSEVYSNCAIEEENGTVEYECTDTNCVTVTFNEDGTFEFIELVGGIEEVTEGTFSIKGNRITICPDGANCGTDTFEVDEETLTSMYTEEGCNVADNFVRYIVLQ